MIRSKEMGTGQYTRKNIQWIEEWKEHIMVVWTKVTKMIMKKKMILSTVPPPPTTRPTKE
jgi:hypothetical protein